MISAQFLANSFLNFSHTWSQRSFFALFYCMGVYSLLSFLNLKVIHAATSVVYIDLKTVCCQLNVTLPYLNRIRQESAYKQ